MNNRWWMGVLAGIAAAVLLVILGLRFQRPTGPNLLVNGSLEDLNGVFNGGVVGRMAVPNGGNQIAGWEVVIPTTLPRIPPVG